MNSPLGEFLESIGTKVENFALDKYAKEENKKAIEQAYNDAVDGKYSTLSGITNANEVYNNALQKLTAPIKIADGSALIDRLVNDITSSPNFDPNTAAKTYMNESDKILSTYIQNVPKDLQGEVHYDLAMKGIDGLKKINQHSVKVRTGQAEMATYDALDKLKSQAEEYMSQGDISNGDKYLNLYKQTVGGLATTGLISPSKEKYLNEQATLQAYTNLGTNGMGKIPENLPIDMKNRIQSQILSHNSLQTKVAKTELSQKGIEYNDLINKLEDGQNVDTSQLPLNTPTLQNDITRASTVGNTYNAMRNLPAEKQIEFMHNSDLFKNLNTQDQNKIRSKVITFQRDLKYDPSATLGIEDQPLDTKIATLKTYGISPANAVSKQQLQSYQESFAANPISAVNNIMKDWHQYSQPIIAKVAKTSNTAGLMLEDEDRASYLKSLQKSPHSRATSWISKLGSNMQKSLLNLDDDTRSALIDNVSRVSINSTGDSKALFKQKFDTLGSNIVYKADKPLLKNQTEIKRLFDNAGIKIDGDLKYKFIAQNNSYQLLNDDNEPIVHDGKSIFITRKQLTHVKPHTFLGIGD